ncbi:MAG TPA: lipid-A-disaccharide synthase [Caulobacteraceae bacterium]|jgi:lipid-A-disaccharide synthase
MSRALCIMLVAAEPSGDALGAGLMRALRRRLGEGVRFVGVGGARMEAEGLQSPFDIADLSILGWAEGLKAYPRVVKRADETAALAARERPDAAVLIDSWGFTLRVAQRLRRQDPGLKLIKYVGPQVWASRPGRARTLAKAVDHLLSILAFDAPYFERAGLKVTAVGNPTLAKDFSSSDPHWLREALGAAPDDPILLVLPGSRRQEVARLMGPFGDAVARLKQSHPTLHVVLAPGESVADQARAATQAWPVTPFFVEGEAERIDAMRGSTLALACSGTVTTELALAGCPMVVAYRVSELTYVLVKIVVRTRWATLVNIAAGREIAPELLQHRCNGPELAKVMAERLDDEALRRQQIADQTEALGRLGPVGGADPSERAADVVVALVEGREPPP